MCLNPTRILNRNYDPSDPYSPKWLVLPCGHCAECRDIRTMAYSYRFQTETFNCQSHHGKASFITLTYDDAHLPKVLYKDSRNYRTHKTYECSTWNKKHVQNYFKTIRQKLYLAYGVERDAFKYSLVCERGKNGTKRPHYHFCAWVYAPDILPLKPQLLHDYDEHTHKVIHEYHGDEHLHAYIDYCWSHFWTYGEMVKVENVDRDSAGAAKYIAKYVTKQMSDKFYFIPKDCIVHHNQFIDYKDMEMFTLQSIGVGSSVETALTLGHYLGTTSVHVVSKNKALPCRLPRYYYERNLKIVRKDTSRVRTYIRIKSTWTSKDGYLPAHCAVLLGEEEYTFVDKDGNSQTGLRLRYRDELTSREFIAPYPTMSLLSRLGVDYKQEQEVLAAEKAADSIDCLRTNPKYYWSRIDSFDPSLAAKYEWKLPYEIPERNSKQYNNWWLSIDSILNGIKDLDYTEIVVRFKRMVHEGVQDQTDADLEYLLQFIGVCDKCVSLANRNNNDIRYAAALPTAVTRCAASFADTHDYD